MADNKFIERLKGKETEKSVLEIKNQATKLSFANMPQGTSNAIDVFSDHRGDATAVLNGTTNWKISNADLLLADTVSGDGEDFLSTYSVSGAGLWVNSTYTFPSTGDPKHPIAMIFNPSTKWVLKVCGDNLIVDGGSTIEFTMLIKIGTANIYSKNFTVRESAGQFSKEFVIDFGEANSDIVKAGGLSTLTVQLLCGTANASVRIYNGMSVLTCLQRKVDASAVSNNGGNVEDVLNGNMVPADYFSNPEFIDQIEDGKDAYAVFTRDGDDVDLSGWTSKDKFIVKSEIIPEASTVPVGSVYMYMGETNTEFVHGYIYQNVKQDDLVVWERMDVQPNNGGGGNVDSVNGKTGVVVLTGEDIAADVSELTDTVQGHLQTLHDSIKDIELFKFPNVIIIGEPIIDHGQISGFTANDYLQFPFIVDLHNQPFQIDFCFTTGEDVTTQQNILDSQFGLALAIRNGKGVMAISHNGTSWVAEIVGTRNILPNTTYYARLSWNRINYKTELSTDGITYVSDMNFGSTQSPYPRTMFIGGCSGSAIGHTPHPFKGTINLNYAYLTVSGNVIWQGMDDAGLATRADISLDNLDEFGQAKFDAKQNKLVAGQNIVINETTNTISATGDGETIKNQNASSSIEKTYDWTGTLQQAINQNVRALHPNWKIFITDDVAGGESVYTKSQVYSKSETDAGFVHKAGDDEIAGNKTFNTSRILLQNALSGNATRYTINDANGKGFIQEVAYYYNSSIINRVLAHNNTSGKDAYLDIVARDNGTSYASFVGVDTPAPSSNDGTVATTGWTKALLNNHYITSYRAPLEMGSGTWYRRYADGWVEQGGTILGYKQSAGTTQSNLAILPIPLSASTDSIIVTFITDGGNATGLRNHYNELHSTYLDIGTYSTTNISNNYIIYWEVKGVAA